MTNTPNSGPGYTPGNTPPPFEPQGPNAYGTPAPGAPMSKADAKRQLREAKANSSWFARHKILTALLVIVGLMIAGTVISSMGGDGGNQAAAPGTSTTAGGTQSGTTAPAEKPAEPAKPKITNGDHLVGTDLAAGLYRAEVDKGIISLCTVSQSQGENILAVANANEGSVIFMVQDIAGSVAKFSGCTNIGLAAENLRPNPATLTNGYWLVGDEIPAGQYRGSVNMESAIKLGTITQSSTDGNVIDINNANEGNVIFTVQDLPGTIVSFSGLKDIQKVG